MQRVSYELLQRYGSSRVFNTLLVHNSLLVKRTLNSVNSLHLINGPRARHRLLFLLSSFLQRITRRFASVVAWTIASVHRFFSSVATAQTMATFLCLFRQLDDRPIGNFLDMFIRDRWKSRAYAQDAGEK